jgi:methylase of polypeptide subunit release factors
LPSPPLPSPPPTPPLYSTGSGCVITYAHTLLSPMGGAQFFATDINPAALLLAQATAQHNEVSPAC